MSMVLLRQHARGRGEFRSGHFSPYGAGRHTHLRIVADAFHLSHVTARHHVKPVAFFAKPYRRGDTVAILAKCFQRNISLAVNRCGNLTGHIPHFPMWNGKSIRRCRFWFATAAADCSRPVICVTSLNMRKWMRDRLQRRKKKSPEPENPPAPPLQPAYFDQESPAQAEAAESKEEISTPQESAFETQPEAEEPSSTEPAEQATASSDAAAGSGDGSARGRTRRRRGGRGRGGRGREKAVAQSFAPAAGKGTIPELPTEGAEDSAGPGEMHAALPEAPKIPTSPAAASRPPKGIVVLAIGLPGSGKSSWFKRHNVVPLSSDMLRSVLFDDVREQRFQDLVFSNLRSMLKARLIAKRPMNYVDATNLTPQERQHWVKLAKDYNYEVHAVFFDVPLEVCIDRHQRRDRVVPEDIMRRMAAKLKPPAFDEGFAKITVVRVKKKE
jgi:predicted kinase